ncbi:hypothetical protein C486_10534 [Natrinema gari JCM 14663]|uniref:Uncharacterized protein n=1 Tax=Natrinema gari JCM 14663 TaxID=1230459 RepID=L9Z172_9EURY|nr:hypothetical protein C486_10534 [Natrinema gari JCM 14663]
MPDEPAAVVRKTESGVRRSDRGVRVAATPVASAVAVAVDSGRGLVSGATVPRADRGRDRAAAAVVSTPRLFDERWSVVESAAVCGSIGVDPVAASVPRQSPEWGREPTPSFRSDDDRSGAVR